VAVEAGQMLSHYRLVEQIGSGGMGVVWKAEDTILGRTVAIKLLSSLLVRDEKRREMFLNEARLASTVSESYIAQVYEFGHQDDFDFLVMEFVDGKPLSRFLQGRPLASLMLAKLGSQVAQALAGAHEKGLIHRDLKPANILVTKEGNVKVVDFGLATLFTDHGRAGLEEPTGTLETGTDEEAKPRTIAGTPYYMSPEQVRGEKLDARSDIFSLGIVLYQMTTGRLPFRGDTQELLAGIQRSKPTPVPELVPKVPIELDRIINKALIPHRDERYQNMEDLAVDLKLLARDLEAGSSPSYTAVSKGKAADEPRPGAVTADARRWWPLVATASLAAAIAVLAVVLIQLRPGVTPEPAPETSARKRIVVLPFENLGLPEDEYFAIGMTEEITSRLAAVSGLGVISRKSALEFANSGQSIKKVGDELGVGFVLEGTIRWARAAEGASRVRITPQLIRVSDDTNLWAETYDRVIDDVFTIQSEIAGEVIDRLGVALLEPERLAMAARPTESLEAYQSYLRGLDYQRRPQYTAENQLLQVEMFQRAVQLDPDFSLAEVALSRAHAAMYHFGHDRTPERQAMAREHADRALEMSPQLPEAHAALGWYYYWCHKDYGHAMEAFDVAGRNRPNDDQILFAIGVVNRRKGEWSQTLAALKRAYELSPLDALHPQELAMTYMWLRDYEQAEGYYEQSVAIAPDQRDGYTERAILYWLWKGDLEASRRVLEEIPVSDDPSAVWYWFWQEMYEGSPRAAIERLASESRDMLGEQFYFAPRMLLMAYAHDSLGERAEALEAYEVAREQLLAELGERPDDHRARSALGIALGGLGRSEEAIREGMKAVEMYPIERDALAGPPWVVNLAVIYTMAGEKEAAIDAIESVLSIPSRTSVVWFRLDPRFEPLWEEQRFQALMDAHDTKESTWPD
jgi:TolB-like protein/Flp pilus assembly protein TadD/predicted Ser/Thr protein kinase